MNENMNRAIIDVIKDYPEVGTLLNGYGVACVTCSVGKCLLKDVLSIHNFDKDEEERIMAEIQEVITNGIQAVDFIQKDVKTAKISQEKTRLSYSPAMERLVDEHDNIKRVLAVVPKIIENIEECDKNVLNSIIYFIKNYADKYHHAKEEDILFNYAEKSREIIDVMIEEHILGRGYVAMVVQGIENSDNAMIGVGLKMYRELLLGHIMREDEVLYPWFDKNMTKEQYEEMEKGFIEADKLVGESFVKGIMIFIDGLESRFYN